MGLNIRGIVCGDRTTVLAVPGDGNSSPVRIRGQATINLPKCPIKRRFYGGRAAASHFRDMCHLLCGFLALNGGKPSSLENAFFFCSSSNEGSLNKLTVLRFPGLI